MAGGMLDSGSNLNPQLVANTAANKAANMPPGYTQDTLGRTIPVTNGDYTWDPVKQKYAKSPTQAGADAGSAITAFMNSSPALAGLGGAAGGAAGTGVGGVGGAGGAVGAGATVGPLQMPDMNASNNATFAAAKDKVGQISRASLDSLAGEFGASGRLGSGADTQATRDTILSGAGQLGDVARGQAQTNAATNLDVAKTNYAGGITQRGQDINAQEANARLALESRQQMLSVLSTVLRGLNPSSGDAYGLY